MSEAQGKSEPLTEAGTNAAVRPRRRARAHYEGDPTILRVMVRPKWILALMLALAVAAGFAWLGQWQLSHAITVENEQAIDVETARPLASVTGPGEAITDASAGLVFTTVGAFVPDDFFVVEERSNGGEVGAWVVGHFVTHDAKPGHLAVAVGWARSADAAAATLDRVAAATLGTEFEIEGRYMPGDAAVRPDADTDPLRVLSMAPAQLVNLWQPFSGHAYPGFLVLHPTGQLDGVALAALDLAAIDSVPPLPVGAINWLNLFYAIEWVVFAGFAVFFWFRLVRDDWEKAHELQRLGVSEAAA